MTFTVLARDGERIGAATASRSLAVGASVIAVDPAVGAVASQAWTNRGLRALLLGELRAGASAEAAVQRVPEWDAGEALRQVGALPWDGIGAARSGVDISAWAGARITPDAVFVGNLLAGAGVLDAMATAWADAAGTDLADRLLAVLRAGDDAGGDARGRQSAALLVASRAETVLDLRVDDHADPLCELARLRRLADAPVEVPAAHG
ncbi:DUF1028 domain-containing protein [Microbacterium trichothecenolyticum]|uniref:Ntn-hydrolase superfamily protein n=1 Tax=Microbacterium trichothecenolyticum TaxID=69370 RepID=A0ABU0TSD1_MICTR|nr:DUF1028 domain-containing protein [Microbacterium trichothecenolyticum]MDQ1122566.1 putative Ntn-hydrolase superfamily protein [Microbacterium trichothecenolyticum]